jgi:hypothetical protein
MTVWRELTPPSKEAAKCFCPGCGATLNFKEELKYPELLKCKCGAQWCLIEGSAKK